MKQTKILALNLILITNLAIFLNGCSDAGFKGLDSGLGGNDTPADPIDPGSPSTILPAVTIENPIENMRVNFENFSGISASGT